MLLPGLPLHTVVMHRRQLPFAQGAKEDYDAAVAMDPASPDALLSRGLFRLDGGKLQVTSLPQGLPSCYHDP